MNGRSCIRQRGFSLAKLMMVSAVVGVFAVCGMKLVPEYLEYYKINKNVTAVAQEASKNPNVTVADVRLGFERRAEIDHIKGFTSAELDVTKEGNQVVVSFEYQRKVHMFKNISVLIDFSGSSAD